MTKALVNELVQLDAQAARWEGAYIQALRNAALTYGFYREIKARISTLVNLSAWVNGRW